MISLDTNLPIRRGSQEKKISDGKTISIGLGGSRPHPRGSMESIRVEAGVDVSGSLKMCSHQTDGSDKNSQTEARGCCEVAKNLVKHPFWLVHSHFFLITSTTFFQKNGFFAAWNQPQGWHLSPFFTFPTGCDQSCIGDDATCFATLRGSPWHWKPCQCASLIGIWLLYRGQAVTSKYEKRYTYQCMYIFTCQSKTATDTWIKGSHGSLIHHLYTP